jgi:DNA-binding NtrC family response regulator
MSTGETGTGKEVFARALHAASARRDGPFVAVNCAAIPASLFEAELFGHRRGAFTGAVRDHVGFAQQADGGVLFLDEIGELPLDVQPKLLRLLQDRAVQPVGAERAVRIDVRLVAATHRDLAQEVAAKRFREDLFYRVHVVDIRLPALRERAADVPELVQHLLERIGRQAQTIAPRAMKRLTSYEWPGNVRELENELQRASILAGGDPIELRHLSEKLRGTPDRAAPGSADATLSERLAVAERAIIREVLARTHGNRTHAARVLGLTRQGLVRKLQRLGLT